MKNSENITTSIVSKIHIVKSYEDVKNKLSLIESLLYSDMEGYLLMLMAAEGYGNGEIVEIGSYVGKSTCWLAYGSRKSLREKVTAIDHFRGSSEHQIGAASESKTLLEEGSLLKTFIKNIKLAGVNDYIEVIVSSSEKAAKNWRKPIRLLFIDAEHSFNAVKSDFELWSPFIIEEGYVIFHDVINEWPDVLRYYNELIHKNSQYIEIISIDSIKVIQKKFI